MGNEEPLTEAEQELLANIKQYGGTYLVTEYGAKEGAKEAAESLESLGLITVHASQAMLRQSMQTANKETYWVYKCKLNH